MDASIQPITTTKPSLWAYSESVRMLTTLCHERAVAGGWWSNPATGERIERNFGELIALMHSELSEALEAHRKGIERDEKLPQHPAVTVELADLLIRVFDAAGALGYDLGGALVDKLEYNARRADHTAQARTAAGGKRY